MHTGWTLTWCPLPLTCSLHPCFRQHGGGGVAVGWGAMRCNNVPYTSLPRTCSLQPRLGQHSRVGVGWGWVGCNNVLALCTRIERSLGIHFHLSAHSIHAFVSLGRVGWRWGWGEGAITFLAHHFHFLAHCTHVLVGRGGVGSGAITYLRSARGLDVHVIPWSAWRGWGGGGWSGVRCNQAPCASVPLPCSWHPSLWRA